MSKYIVEQMTAEALRDAAFSFETGEPIQLEPGSVHWAVLLLDDAGEQTDDDYSFFPTQADADASCQRLNELLAQERAANESPPGAAQRKETE